MQSWRSERQNLTLGQLTPAIFFLKEGSLFQRATQPPSFGEPTNLGSPLLVPASKFLFVACTRVENKRICNAAANIIDEGRKALKGAQSLVFLKKNVAHVEEKMKKKNKKKLAHQIRAKKKAAKMCYQ